MSSGDRHVHHSTARKDRSAALGGAGDQFNGSGTGQSRPFEHENPNRRMHEYIPTAAQYNFFTSNQHASSNGAGGSTYSSGAQVSTYQNQSTNSHNQSRQPRQSEPDTSRHGQTSRSERTGARSSIDHPRISSEDGQRSHYHGASHTDVGPVESDRGARAHPGISDEGRRSNTNGGVGLIYRSSRGMPSTFSPIEE
jgi:hypothetical protein